MRILPADDAVINAAFSILELGWAPLPLKHQSKVPVVRYKLMTEAPNENTVESWFKSERRGLGVLLGHPSGGLICRDFDTEVSYEKWRDRHPNLADLVPTTKTHRGYHVYSYGDPKQVQEFSPTGRSLTIHGDDGELKANGFAVLPPSAHELGKWTYTWKIPPWDDVPYLSNLPAAGLVPEGKHKPNGTQQPCNAHSVTEALPPPEDTLENQRFTQGIYSPAGLPGPGFTQGIFSPNQGALVERLQEAVRRSLPNDVGQRNRCIFQFCRYLKGFPEFANRRPDDLREEFLVWYRGAYSVIGTKEFGESWKDFCTLWNCVDHPMGSSISNIFDCTSGTRIDRLTQLCELLQATTAPNPFNLDCRTVARLFGKSHTTANNWLNGLISQGVLELAKPHQFARRGKGRAREFFYRGNKPT